MACLTGPFLILLVRPQSKSWGLKVLSETGHQTRGFRLAAPAWSMIHGPFPAPVCGYRVHGGSSYYGPMHARV